jgi:hypothetical protein
MYRFIGAMAGGQIHLGIGRGTARVPRGIMWLSFFIGDSCGIEPRRLFFEAIT